MSQDTLTCEFVTESGEVICEIGFSEEETRLMYAAAEAEGLTIEEFVLLAIERELALYAKEGEDTNRRRSGA